MKFLHTADWHLGRYFHGASLLEDQAHVLDQFVALAVSEKVDAVVIAGDVYDRPCRRPMPLSLLDDVLSRLVVGAGIPVILIAGNHDSAERIGFGGRIFERQGLILRGPLGRISRRSSCATRTAGRHPSLALRRAGLRPRAAGRRERATDHQSAMAHVVVACCAPSACPGQRNVLVGHAFVAGGTESESERPLSVGGSGHGRRRHLRRLRFRRARPPAPAADGRLRSHPVLRVTAEVFLQRGRPRQERLAGRDRRRRPAGPCAVAARRRAATLRIITGTLAELLAQPDPASAARRLPLRPPHRHRPGARADGRLREVYPNMMELQFAAADVRQRGGHRAAGDHRRRASPTICSAPSIATWSARRSATPRSGSSTPRRVAQRSGGQGRSMKPLVVEMQAFGPFAGRQVIDFRRLGSKTFFLIHGPTGSGKTTILDAHLLCAVRRQLGRRARRPADAQPSRRRRRR